MGGHKMGKINWKDLNSEKEYNHLNNYAQSKLANILFAKKLSQLYEKDQIKGVSLHPGVIRTELARYYISGPVKKALMAISTPVYWYFTKNISQGAQTTLQCALEDYDKLVAGGYYSDCVLAQPSIAARNAQDADKLWIESLRMLNLTPQQ